MYFLMLMLILLKT